MIHICSLPIDVALLKRIPLLQPLPGSEDGQLKTLFDWINKYDHQKDLEQMASLCLQAIEKITQDSMTELRERNEEVVSSSSIEGMKEIKGLEERLSGLEHIMAQVKKINLEQQDQSNALFKNQQRASNLRDNSILPDLCRNHKTSLLIMLKNYEILREKRTTVANAKKELSNNLHQRLKWVMNVEKRMLEASERIMMIREKIRRLKLQMDVVRQIHQAPQLYVDAVIEVIRRRSFASKYHEWTVLISGDSNTVHETEIFARRTFTPKLNCHFLSTMFPGISDRPPAFAINSPPQFDQQLPQLCDEHIQVLREMVPDLVENSSMKTQSDAVIVLQKYLNPVVEHISDSPETHSVAIDCSVLSLDEKSSSVDQLMVLDAIKNSANCVAQVKDCAKDIRQDFIKYRSELTATHSKIEKEIAGELRFIIQRFHENMSKIEEEKTLTVEQLQSEISDLKMVNGESMRRELEMKEEIKKIKSEFESEMNQVNMEKEKLKVALVERECEVEDEMKKELDAKEKFIQTLSTRVTSLQDTVEELSEKIVSKEEEIGHLMNNAKKLEAEMQVLIDNHGKEVENVKLKAEEETNRAVKEMKDRLTADHKNELESLRSRFKLAVSTTTIEKAQEPLSLEQGADREAWLNEKRALMDQLEELKLKQEENLKGLKKDHEEEITRLKQVQFNETLNKLMKEKDEEISRLKEQFSRRHSTSDRSQVPLSSSSSSSDKVAVMR